MTDMASWLQAVPANSRWFAEPRLAAAGFFALALVPAGALWASRDRRLVAGERAALKPTRFALSIGVYLLTASWALGYARAERLSSPLVQVATWGLLVGAAVELSCIVLQAARGRRSHFNVTTSADATISAVMAVMAILFIGMVLPLAWEIARRPRPDAAPLMVQAVVGGLVATFILGALTGAVMGRSAANSMGAEAVPLRVLGLGVRGGTSRISHFLGVHAMQAFPLMASAASAFQERTATILLTVGALCYCAATLALAFRSMSHDNKFSREIGVQQAPG